MDEKNLVKQILTGDENAFLLMIRQNKERVLNVCYRFVQNNEDAEDIAQEVFIEVYKSIKKFNFKSKLSTWIYKITINKCIDFLRIKKRKEHISDFISIFSKEFHYISRILQSSENPQKNLESEEANMIIIKALKQLPENQRIALTLIKLDNLSYKETSEIMELSIGAVEALMIRAKKNLKKYLEKTYV